MCHLRTQQHKTPPRRCRALCPWHRARRAQRLQQLFGRGERERGEFERAQEKERRVCARERAPGASKSEMKRHKKMRAPEEIVYASIAPPNGEFETVVIRLPVCVCVQMCVRAACDPLYAIYFMIKGDSFISATRFIHQRNLCVCTSIMVLSAKL